jgi:hypothetical protein
VRNSRGSSGRAPHAARPRPVAMLQADPVPLPGGLAVLKAHQRISAKELRSRAQSALAQVGFQEDTPVSFLFRKSDDGWRL